MALDVNMDAGDSTQSVREPSDAGAKIEEDDNGSTTDAGEDEGGYRFGSYPCDIRGGTHHP